MNQNHTTPLPTPPHNKPGYFAFIPLLLLTLTGCIVAVVYYFRRRSRLDELRHRLIPLYSYDPAEEEEEWGDIDGGNKEQELAEPLYNETQLLFPSDYGT
ncbi:small integral membrane protein 29-like [Nematolebias whitei]|uniref:small integral membrane protein 29-like n=1 Tax=Nematolebias whitei TaxID=451745 RepID=UPI00189A86DE|nr:small integral membrane protein 29-like [Nematolebias whitei]XP_037538912.1 small integral membrane protein 29-like [Nematolebias whitei]